MLSSHRSSLAGHYNHNEQKLSVKTSYRVGLDVAQTFGAHVHNQGVKLRHEYGP